MCMIAHWKDIFKDYEKKTILNTKLLAVDLQKNVIYGLKTAPEVYDLKNY